MGTARVTPQQPSITDGHANQAQLRPSMHIIRPELNRRLSGVLRHFIFDYVHYGVLLVSKNRKIVWMNSIARTLLKQNDGLSIDRNQLTALKTGTTREIQKLIDQRYSSLNVGYRFIRIQRPSCRRPFELIFPPEQRRMQNESEHCMCSPVLIFDPETESVPDIRLIMEIYGLTMAESVVVALLMQGKTLHQITRLLHKRKETVRKQLQSAFAKTNTNRQSDLIRLLLRGPAALIKIEPRNS
jgi:DNA-binding CsgD family transcriptional regulator